MMHSKGTAGPLCRKGHQPDNIMVEEAGLCGNKCSNRPALQAVLLLLSKRVECLTVAGQADAMHWRCPRASGEVVPAGDAA